MSCLFDSLSYFFKIEGYNIRQIICNYLQQNKKIIDGLDTHFILSLDDNNYINRMRMNDTWGGAIEIQAACNIWNVKIIIYNKRNHENSIIEFVPIDKIFSNVIKLSWNGNHYEPM